jgi:hypothetical protein
MSPIKMFFAEKLQTRSGSFDVAMSRTAAEQRNECSRWRPAAQQPTPRAELPDVPKAAQAPTEQSALFLRGRLGDFRRFFAIFPWASARGYVAIALTGKKSTTSKSASKAIWRGGPLR